LGLQNNDAKIVQDLAVHEGAAKSPSIPLYKRGKILKWFQQIPPFHKGGLGGISFTGTALVLPQGVEF
jgi:hypothetical protein